MKYLSIILILFFALSVLAQKQTSTPAPIPRTVTKTTVNNVSCYSNQQIKLTAEKLPLNYYGNDFIKLAEEISIRSALTNDEFETTQKFQERKEAVNKKPVIGNLTISNLFAFEGIVNFKYDADNQSMSAQYDFRLPYNWISLCNGINNIKKSVFSFLRFF